MKKKADINVTRSSMPNFNTYCDTISELWNSKILTNSGSLHNLLEQKLAKYMDVENLALFTNGHIALETALYLLKKKGEVITTPFTFSSTTQAIVRTGNVPVFCDIKDDYTIDEDKIEQLINEKTIAILPIHVYGNVCNVERIQEIARRHNLFVIYDAAHVFGVKYKNLGIASYGDISMFSFHATKVFHTIEGGALCFRDGSHTKKLIAMRNFGQTSSEQIDFIGGNGKMDEFRAAMGLCMLDIIDNEIRKRKKIHDRYVSNLKSVDGIVLNKKQRNVTANYAYFPVLFNNYKYDRNQIFELLMEHNIIARKYFYPLTSEFNAFKGMFPIQTTPVAKFVSENILCLPIYSDLEVEEVDRICKIIIKGVL